jgi:peptidoglycan/LPS O-acetylase OafA/YrhL
MSDATRETRPADPLSLPAQSPGGTGGRDPTLDVFRGIAILCVALYHFTARLPHEALNMSEPAALQAKFGWLGVYFFFVISGFCIFLTLSRSDSVRLFFAKRISRLYPAFVAAAIVLFVFGLFAPVPTAPAANYHDQPITLVDLALNLMLLGELGEWVNGSFWSIAAEVRFYLLIALMAVLFGRGARLARLFSYLALGMAGLWLLVEILLPAQDGALASRALRVAGLAPYLPFFAFGILLHQRHKKAMPTTLLLSLNAVVMALVLVVETIGSSYIATIGLVDIAIVVTIFAVLMGAFVRFADGHPLPAIPIAGPILAYAGLLSYSWYLMHETLGLTLLGVLGPHLPLPLNVLIALGATLAAAAVFSWAVEWRFRKPVEAFALRVLSLPVARQPARMRRSRPAE